MEKNLRHDPLHQNYNTVIHGFAYVGKALEPYTRAGLRKVHQEIYRDCAGLPPCVGRCSENFGRDLSRWCGSCNAWRSSLQRRRRGSFSRWENTESWRWAVDYESIASVFLPTNWSDDCTSLSDISTASHIWSNCTEFNISKSLLSNVKNVRNKHFAHNADLKVIDADHKKVFDTLKKLLRSNVVQPYINIATCTQDLNRVANGHDLTDFMDAIEEMPSSVAGGMSISDARLTIDSVCMARAAYNQINKTRPTRDRSRQRAGRRLSWTLYWGTSTFISLVLMAIFSSVQYPVEDDCISEMYTYPFEQDIPLLPYLQEHSILIGRRWLFKDIEKSLLKFKTSIKGVLLTADMGYGKSAIVRHLLCSKEYEKGHVITRHIVSFHVCKFDIPSTKDPQRFILRIVGFLSTRFPQYGEVISMLPESSLLFHNELCRQNIIACFDQGILHPIRQLQDVFSYLQIVVIDGLDECNDERTGRNDIFELFKARYRDVPELLRFIITSRNSSDIDDYYLSKLKIIELSSSDKRNLEDIAEFFEFKAAIYPNIRNISGGVQTVLKHSEGNFLYAIHSLDFLNNNDGFDNYPKTISDVYENNFLRLFASKEEYYIPKQILEVVLVTIYPLTRGEVSNILAETIHTSDLRNYMKKLSFCFRSDLEITFLHQSLHTWLTDEDNKQFRVSIETGHAALSRYFLTHVNKSLTDVVDIAIHVSESKDVSLANLFETVAHSYKIDQGTLHRLIWKTSSSAALRLLTNLKLDVNSLNAGDVSPVFVAASKGHLNQLKLLFSVGANMNFIVNGSSIINSREQIDIIKHSFYFGYGLIHIAASFGHFDIVNYLIHQNQSILSIRTDPGMTASEIACENGHHNILQLVLDNGADVGHCLYYAAKGGHTHIVQWLAENGVNVSCLSEHNSIKALDTIYEVCRSKAALKKTLDMYMLTSKMADLWWIVLQETPLHAAIKFNHANTVELLIRYYPHLIKCSDAFGLTPFLLSVTENQTYIFEMLIDRVTKDKCRIQNGKLLQDVGGVFSDDEFPMYPLGAGYMHLDAILKRPHMTETLISRNIGLSWLRSDESSNTPVHYSACTGNTVFLETFRKFNSISFENIKSKNGSTPFHSATICGSILSLEVMKKLSVKHIPMVKDNHQRTLLHYVALREFHGNPAKQDWNQQIKSLKLMRGLLEWPNINIDDSDSYLRNVLHYALFNGNYLIVEYIIENYQHSFKAMINQKDIYGNSPVSYALKRLNRLESFKMKVFRPGKCHFFHDIFDSYCYSYEALNRHIPSWEMGLITVLLVIRGDIKGDFRKHYKQIIVQKPYLTTALLVFLNIGLDMNKFEEHFIEGLPEMTSPWSIMSVARHQPFIFRKCQRQKLSSPLHVMAYKSEAASLIPIISNYPFELRDLNCPDTSGYNTFHYALLGGNVLFAKKLFEIGVDITTERVRIKDIPNMMIFGKKNNNLILTIQCGGQLSCIDTLMSDIFKKHLKAFNFSDFCVQGRSDLSLVHLIAASGLEKTLKLLKSRFGGGLFDCKNRDALTPAYFWTLLNERSSIEVFNTPITVLPQLETERSLLMNIINNFPFKKHNVSLSCLLNNNVNLPTEILSCLRKIHRMVSSEFYVDQTFKDLTLSALDLLKEYVYSLLNYRQWLQSKYKPNQILMLQTYLNSVSSKEINRQYNLSFNYPGLKRLNAQLINDCLISHYTCPLYSFAVYQEYRHMVSSFVTDTRHAFINVYFMRMKHEALLPLARNNFIKKRLSLYRQDDSFYVKNPYRRQDIINLGYRHRYLNLLQKTVKYQYFYEAINPNPLPRSSMSLIAIQDYEKLNSVTNMTGPLENTELHANSSSYFKNN